MHLTLRVLVLTILAASAGCRMADRPSAGSVRHEPVVKADDGPPSTESGTSDAPVTGKPAGVLTLREVLMLSLSRSPELQVYPYELRAADARMLQAGLLPNPEFAIDIEELAGSGDRSGFDAAETTVRIDQPIELGGKRTKRTRVAQLDRELTEWDYKSARLDAICEATRAFVAVLAAQDRVVLARKLVELSRQAQAAVAQRVEAGRDSPVDALRASVALSTTRIEQQKAEKTLAAARHGLAAVWGGKVAAFEQVSGSLYEISPPAPPEDPSAAIMANPDVSRWETQERKQRAVLHLEKANAVPDIAIGGGVQRFEETDDSALVIGLSVPIPLFDRNQGGIREAVADLAKTRRLYEAAQVRTLAALSEAVSAMSVAYQEATALRDDVLPKAEQAFQAAQDGYRQGKFDYLSMLDAQRTLFETQAGYIDAVEACHGAQADVRRLIGEVRPGMDDDLSTKILDTPSLEVSNDE
ncbi:MAG: TolC family protein [Phycisphaerales bacterium]